MCSEAFLVTTAMSSALPEYFSPYLSVQQTIIFPNATLLVRIPLLVCPTAWAEVYFIALGHLLHLWYVAVAIYLVEDTMIFH